MLAITAKAKLLKEEVFSAKNVCKDILGTLRNVSESTDYRKEIGIFALQAPDWKILTSEKHEMQELIRKVCTGEESLEDAKIKFERYLVELNILDSRLQIPIK